MKLKKLLLATTLALSVMAVADDTVDTTVKTQIVDTSYASYARMTTPELQEAIEHVSQHGDLPFEMGLELFKRWTKDDI